MHRQAMEEQVETQAAIARHQYEWQHRYGPPLVCEVVYVETCLTYISEDNWFWRERQGGCYCGLESGTEFVFAVV
jgi:hypothetical protein